MKESQTHLLEHSKAKVDLLGKYLAKYLQIITLAGYTKQIHLYDLFCSEGVYENGGEGSPIVVLKAVRQFMLDYKGSQPIPIINFYFNDIELAKVEKLKKIITERQLHDAHWGHLSFTNESYEDALKKVVPQVKSLHAKKEKAFIFVDPYDYKSIRASQIKDLVCPASEVLLFQPSQFMFRFAQNGTPEALSLFLSEIVDYSQWKSTDSVWDLIQQITEGFRSYLGEKFYVDTFKIKKDPRTVFCLYFFTPHIRGFQRMLETKWEIDKENGQGWDYQTKSNDSFFGEVKATPQTNLLRRKLVPFLKTKQTNTAIFDFITKAGFLAKHANDVLKSLDNEKRLFLDKKDAKARNGYFYIGDEREMISIQIKK
jgi:three-Cys-motif partner protein